jgi:hypothetical protein
MIQRAIAGYTIESQNGGILLLRSYAGVEDGCLVETFDEATDFLTAEYPHTLHVVWSLAELTDALFALLPPSVVEKLKTETKAYVGNAKIFYTDRVLGITARKPTGEGNFVTEQEVNIYQLQHWYPSEQEVPQDAGAVARLGEQILDGFDKMGIYPDSLTSPVGVFSKELDTTKFPTIYTFRDDWMEAQEYAQAVAPLEWRSAYQIGYWKEAYDFDLIFAYPSIMAGLPHTDQCWAGKSDTLVKSNWGVVYGQVEVTAPVSPLVYNSNDGMINPTGRWVDKFTTEEINWLYKNKAGKFDIKDGWFFRWFGKEKPYRELVMQLWQMRQHYNPMVSHIARRIGQGLSGKLDQTNKDGSTGDMCNFILAAMTRSRCRLKLADYIYSKGLIDNLIAVQVDGFESDYPVHWQKDGEFTTEPFEDEGLGGWRGNDKSPLLVLGKGEIFKPDKRPLGLGFDEVVGAFKEHPMQSYYEFGDKYVDLKVMAGDVDRVYDKFPQTGGDALKDVLKSKPINIVGG